MRSCRLQVTSFSKGCRVGTAEGCTIYRQSMIFRNDTLFNVGDVRVGVRDPAAATAYGGRC